MADYVEPFTSTSENIGKNYLLNRLSVDSNNNLEGEFFVRFVAEDNANPGVLTTCSNDVLVAFPAADAGARTSPDSPLLTFNYQGVVDNLFLVLYAIDPLITVGNDVFQLCIKSVDAANFVDGAQITVENLSFDLNDGGIGMSYDIPL